MSNTNQNQVLYWRIPKDQLTTLLNVLNGTSLGYDLAADFTYYSKDTNDSDYVYAPLGNLSDDEQAWIRSLTEDELGEWDSIDLSTQLFTFSLQPIHYI